MRLMQLMKASARLCKAAACQPARPTAAARRSLASAASSRQQCTLQPALQPGALSRWQPAAGVGSSSGGSSGARSFGGSPPLQRRLRGVRAKAFTTDDIEADVGVMIEGSPALISSFELDSIAKTLYEDSILVLKEAALYVLAEEEEDAEDRDEPPAPLELSLVLCDDAHIRELNAEWRGIDAPTDVLSFELEDDEDDDEYGAPELPINVLGDVVISLDTAAQQAADRRYGLLDEARVLLVHGVLHLLGYDHEESEEEAEAMAAAEQHILKALGWKGQGLIAAAGSSNLHGDDAGSGRGASLHVPEGGASTSAPQQAAGRIRRWSTKPRLLALDMDGTLLDSRSRVLPSSVSAIKAALDCGVTVFLATGKARPAAIRAMQAVGLAGEGLVVSTRGPGIFLQGLAAYGLGGKLIAGGELPPHVVRAAFEFSAIHDVPICGFLGEECVTHKMHPEIEELHHRYYEPLAAVAPIEEVLQGLPMRKLLFMTSPDVVDSHLKPHWEVALADTEAETMQAVPDMLEVVPSGWDKARSIGHLLDHLGADASELMAIGDGSNDLGMVRLAGIGVAMGNAVPAVKEAASFVVADNDSDGVAEAIERMLL